MANVSSSNGLEKYPKLRFPGFDEPYRELCLGNISSPVNRTDSKSKANIMMLSAGKGFIMQSDKYSRDNAGQSLKKYILLQKGELAYNHGASKTKQFGCCYELLENEARIPYVYHCFKIDKKEFTSYVALELNNSKMDKQLKRLVSSSARMDGLLNISFDDYMTVKLTLPSYSEQRKVAKFLDLLEQRIRLQIALVESLKKYKRGLRQQVFPQKGETTPKLRFAGFTVPWEQHKVKNIAPLQRGFDLPTSQIEEGIYPVIMSNGIGGYHSHFKVKGPGIITGRSGTIGKLHYIESDYWPHNTTLWITDFYGNNQKFIYYMYQHLDLSRFSTGSGVPTLNRNDVHNELVWIPSVREQERISEHLTNLDRLITLHQRKLSKFQTLKSALLQQLFI